MRRLLFALLCLTSSLSTFAQTTPNATGNYNFATMDTPGFDSVNVGNLNVRFNIPIVSRSGRGLPFNYSLQYEGLIWSAVTSGGVTTWVPDPAWGFQGALNGTGYVGYMTHSISHTTCDTVGTAHPVSTIYSNYVYHDAFGGTHAFNYSTYRQACPGDDGGSTGDGTSNDNSGYSLNISSSNPNQVFNRRGYSFYPATSVSGQDASSLTDTNGNYISTSGSGSFTDTLGANALTVSGSNPVTFAYPVTRQANNATTASATLSYQNYTVQTKFQCSNIIEYGAQTISLPSRLTLADGSFYQFTYEATPGVSGAVTGRIASVTLPTGGTISYAYGGGCSGAGMNGDGTGGTLARTTSDGTRHYNRSYNNAVSSFTDVIDEKGNDTNIHIFGGSWNEPSVRDTPSIVPRIHERCPSSGSLHLLQHHRDHYRGKLRWRNDSIADHKDTDT